MSSDKLTSLKHIPNIMWANGWTRGFMLMQHWFAGPPFVKPNYASPDLTTIKMDWILSFDRAEDVYADMIREKIWSNADAQKVMGNNLRRRGFLKLVKGNPSTKKFDWSGLSTRDQHELHVNHRKVDGYDLDDLTAALGHFSIYVTPLKGEVTHIGGPMFEVKVSQLGFHVADSYDFEGDQFLGRWDENTNSVSAVQRNHHRTRIPYANGYVENADFREWRWTYLQGGDFQVYSDVRKMPLNPPDSFLVQ